MWAFYQDRLIEGPEVPHLCHGHTASREDPVRGLVRYLDLEGQAVTDPDGLDLLASRVHDRDLRSRGLGRRGDADHVRISDGHHSEGDVPGGGVVRAPDFVDLVGLGHDDAVPLDDDGVGEHAVLKVG